jgi:hypothetical protein
MTEAAGTKLIKLECEFSGENSEANRAKINKDAATAFYEYGTRAETDVNKALCTMAEGTVVEMTCGSANTRQHFQEADTGFKQDVVQLCCGASPTYMQTALLNFKTGGTVSLGNYTDDACSTAATGAWAWEQATLLGTANPATLSMGACLDGGAWGSGQYFNFNQCNGTEGTAQDATGAKEFLLLGLYNDAACTEFFGDHMVEMGCRGPQREGSTEYHKWSCAAAAPTHKQFATTLSVDFGGLASLDATQKTALKTTYESKSLDSFTTALNNAAATVTPTHVYSGALASRRRRLSASRRLSDAGGVTSTFVTTLPAAQADAAQATIVTATSGGSGALTPTAFKATIETEMASNPATAAFAANVTATVAPAVVSTPGPVIAPAGTTGGSTSGAITEFLGLASAVILAGVVMF